MISQEERNAIIERAEKLLRLSGSDNEAEAARAAEKFQELLAQYNLSMGDVEREGGGSGRREEQMVNGGFYQWERDLWREACELNFCLYLSWWDWEAVPFGKPRADGRRYMRSRKRYKHRVIGRRVNVEAAKALAGYLFQVTQRLTLERLHGDNSQMLGRWAISFREGVVARVCEKLSTRRRQMLSEERERERAAQKLAMEGASSQTGLTLATLTQREYEANSDFLMGEGWSARQAAERAEQAMLARMSQEEYTRWAAENPEKAAARAREEREAARRRGSKEPEKQRDWGAFRSGYEAGARVGIDPQAAQQKPAGRLQ